MVTVLNAENENKNENNKETASLNIRFSLQGPVIQEQIGSKTGLNF